VVADLGPFLRELVAQIRAHDMYGLWDGKPDSALLAPFVVDRERARAIPLIGDPDSQTLARVTQFYSAAALLIEKSSGILASPVLQISAEGFGRIVLICGRLVVVSKTVREVHRFGVASLSKLEADGEALVAEAMHCIEQFPDAAKAN